MKIVCDSCGTKYSIADEKVRGKVFKIRCKKCSHIIVVRGGEGATEEAAPAVDGGWHLVIDGEQLGPVSDADVRTKIERGEVKGDTYAWKEGFADWVKLSAVPEFAGAVTGEDVAGTPAPSGELFPAGADPLAAASNGAERARRGSTSVNSLFGGAGSSDVFAAPAPSNRGGDLFGSAGHTPSIEENRWPSAGAPAAGHDGGRVDSLTGQRHENSVLFSLSNLQSLAMPGPAARQVPSSAAPVTEGSGLIDIRAMAASTLGQVSESPSFGGGYTNNGAADDLPAFGSFAPAAPVLMPLQSSGPPKWVYLALVVFAVAVLGIGFMAYKVLIAKPPVLVEQVQAPPPSPEAPKSATPPPAATGETGAKSAAKPTTIADENLPPREGSPAAKADKEKVEHAERGEHHHRGFAGKKAVEEKKAAVVAAAEPAEKRPPKGSLDDLIDGAVGHKGGGSKARGADDDAGKKPDAGPLSKGAVVSGMNSIKPKIADCYADYKVPGMAMVNVVIGKSGKVSSATVTGKFAGTPTGSCVEKAVKSAVFPPSEGLNTPYPFQLR